MGRREVYVLDRSTYLLMLLQPCLLLAWRRMPSWPPQLGVVGARSCVRPVLRRHGGIELYKSKGKERR